MASDPDFGPIQDADWPPGVADMLGGFAGGLNVYRTMAHHPDLLRAWGPLREHVVNKTALGPQLSEVVILRTGVRLGSSYEFHQHIDRARARGLDDARIGSITGDIAAMAPLDGLLARAVDELFDDKALSEATVQGLVQALGRHALFDVIATVGFYSTLGYILNSFETPLDDDVAERLRQNPLTS